MFDGLPGLAYQGPTPQTPTAEKFDQKIGEAGKKISAVFFGETNTSPMFSLLDPTYCFFAGELAGIGDQKHQSDRCYFRYLGTKLRWLGFGDPQGSPKKWDV